MTSIWRYLPACGDRLLACVVAVVSAAYGLLAVQLLINATRAPLAAAVALVFVALCWGMWRLKKWARAITVFVLWFCVIVIPIGVLNPFAAMEWEGGAPRWEVLLAWIVPGVALGLFILHVLGKHRKLFS